MRRRRTPSEYADALRQACPDLASYMEKRFREAGLTTQAEIDLGHYLADRYRAETPTINQIVDQVRDRLAVPA